MNLPATEAVSPRTADLDAWDSRTVLEALWEGQMAAVASVQPALPAIAAAAEAAASRLGDDGRLVYAGAGTSGRIGVQDGVELAPTFDWPESRLVLLMAGGEAAFVRAIENAEDRRDLAQEAIEAAEHGDLAVLGRLMAVLKRPYDEQPEHDALAGKRPDWARTRPGCATLSCSS